jgi:hypothetical protein
MHLFQFELFKNSLISSMNFYHNSQQTYDPNPEENSQIF